MVKVSIIVPVYNVEKYLAKCLDSLVNQTLREIEIIIVNDGSKDDSAQIAQRYATQYPEKVMYLEKENGGLSDARNFGIDYANGAYLAFVDSDDFVLPTMMEEMYGLCQKHDADIAICNLQKVNENGEITQKLGQLSNFPTVFTLAERPDAFADMSYFACNKIFRKNLFAHLRFRKGLHFEDIELIPRILLRVNTIARTDMYHYQYFERTNSISKSHTIRGLDMLEAVETVTQDFKERNMAIGHQHLKSFQILQGYYSFLAYLAFVKEEAVYQEMKRKLKAFLRKNEISKLQIFNYKRFGKNYILSLPLKKKMYYLLHLLGADGIIRKWLV